MTMGAIDQYASYMLEQRRPRENAKITRVAATSATAAAQRGPTSSGRKTTVAQAAARAET
jgi:hypothetical protein